MDERKVAPEIDFSPLLIRGEIFAVHCKTEDDAINFLQRLRQAYPNRCSGWKNGVTHWGKYDTICYNPNLNMPDGYSLRYCYLEYYVREGYTIIPYEHLIIQSDIEESEQQLDLLLS